MPNPVFDQPIFWQGGLASVTAGSDIVTGSINAGTGLSTLWSTQALAGDEFSIGATRHYIEEVVSDTQIRLTEPWSGPTTGAPTGYTIRVSPWHLEGRALGYRMRQLLESDATTSATAILARDQAFSARTGSIEARDLSEAWATRAPGQDVTTSGTRSARHYSDAAGGAAATASTQAGVATSKAGEATAAAGTATTQAGVATNKAQVATDKADIATARAGEAAADRAQTGVDRTAVGADRTAVATDKAAVLVARDAVVADRNAVAADRATASSAATAASGAASTATSQAGTAATQAGIATTKAGEATGAAAGVAADRATAVAAKDDAVSARTLAQEWADKAPGQAVTGTTAGRSARHYAADAAASATAAAQLVIQAGTLIDYGFITEAPSDTRDYGSLV